VSLVAASLSGGSPPEQIDLRGPCALLIGNEGAGLPEDVERSAQTRVRIPLAWPVDSLNAAVAAAVLLYEAARQRRQELRK
jgi:TrmH family RNA methyltransferase